MLQLKQVRSSGLAAAVGNEWIVCYTYTEKAKLLGRCIECLHAS